MTLITLLVSGFFASESKAQGSVSLQVFYDELQPYVHSITVVHPPHVALITRAQVITDRIAAYQLARLSCYSPKGKRAFNKS